VNKEGWSTRAALAGSAAWVLLLLGLVLDLALVRGQMAELRRLRAEEARLQTRYREIRNRGAETLGLAEHFGVEDLDRLEEDYAAVDAVAFLADALSAARLRRLELGTEESSRGRHLRRTQFFLRAQGTHQRILDFIRRMEGGPRVVTLEALSIQRILGSNQLELRANLSVYDPAGDS
jgi:Tfp pilus assembly protein PilO